MKNWLSIVLVSCAVSICVRAEEFVYPVASVSDGKSTTVYVLYQKSLNHIELWAWDETTRLARKALLSSFTPAGLRIIPDNIGFSFIDDGIIRVQAFGKRSPRSLRLYEPVYDMGVVEWIDSTHGYFSAQERGAWGIYHVTMDGDLYTMVADDKSDCQYPQRQGAMLYYIERNDQGHRVMAVPYPHISYNEHNTFNDEDNCEQRFEALITSFDDSERSILTSPSERTNLVDFGSKSIAFLNMISEDRGFVVEHPMKIGTSESFITFTYHMLEEQEASWQRQELFSFCVPAYFLTQNVSRLYESMLPLLPRVDGDQIYYVSSTGGQDSSLSLFVFDLKTGISTLKVDEPGYNIFAPLRVGNKLICGGSLTDYDSVEIAPFMGITADGQVTFNLPVIADKL